MFLSDLAICRTTHVFKLNMCIVRQLMYESHVGYAEDTSKSSVDLSLCKELR